jgi:hypothetical protein
MSSDVVSMNQGPLKAALKAAVPALAFAFGLAAASASHATAIFLNGVSYDKTNTAQLSGPTNSNVYMTPQVFKANYGTTASISTFDLMVFCVDIFHWSGTNLAYDDNLTLTSNSGSGANFDTLDQGQIDQVGYLTNYGAKLYATNPTLNVNKLAAVQGAIWKVVNRDTTTPLVLTASNSAVGTIVNNLAGASYLTHITSDVGAVSKNITFIKETANYGQANSHQAFVFAAVPEPATWAMMIMGFAGLGVMLRRQRSLAVA